MQSVPFKADGHQISVELYQYTRDLLALGTYTLKQVAEITGLGKNTVKALDLKRLKEPLYHRRHETDQTGAAGKNACH